MTCPAALKVRRRADIAQHLPELIDLAVADEPDPQDVYARLKAAGHHDQSQLLSPWSAGQPDPGPRA